MAGITFQGTQYAARTKCVAVTTSNPNLDGSGDIYQVLEVDSDRGIFIKSIIVKAFTSTTLGMVRLFTRRGSIFNLLLEIPVPITNIDSGNGCSFHVLLPINYSLKYGDILYATTQNEGEYFNVIAECLKWEYGETLPNEGAIYKAVTSGNVIETANPSMTGLDGDIVGIFTTNSNVNTEITSIIIKAQESTSSGMVRLFLSKGREEFFLFAEIMIPGVAQSGSNPAFQCEVISCGSLSLQSDYEILATTQNSEEFSITIEAFEWYYPS